MKKIEEEKWIIAIRGRAQGKGTVVCFYTELKEEEEDNNQPIVTVHRWMD